MIVMSPSKLISSFNEAKLGVSRIAADGAKADPRRGGGVSVLLSAVLVFTCLGIYKSLQERLLGFFSFSFSAHKMFDLLKFVEDKAGVSVSRVLKRKGQKVS